MARMDEWHKLFVVREKLFYELQDDLDWWTTAIQTVKTADLLIHRFIPIGLYFYPECICIVKVYREGKRAIFPGDGFMLPARG